MRKTARRSSPTSGGTLAVVVGRRRLNLGPRVRPQRLQGRPQLRPAAGAGGRLDRRRRRARPQQESDDLSHWWTVFNDPVLDDLVCTAYRQNLTLREAGFRVLQARAAAGHRRRQASSRRRRCAERRLSPATRSAARSPTAVGIARQRFFGQWDRLQPGLGAGFLGPLPPGHRGRRRRPRRLRRELRRRAGHPARRRGDATTCRSAPSSSRSPTRRPTSACSARRSRSPRPASRAGRPASWTSTRPRATCRRPRRSSAAGDRAAPGEQPALRAARHSAGGPAGQARARRRSRPRRRTWPSASRPTCSAAGPTSAAPSAQAAAQSARIGVAEADFYPHDLASPARSAGRPQTSSDLFAPTAFRGQRRPVVPVEHPQLRPAS